MAVPDYKHISLSDYPAIEAEDNRRYDYLDGQLYEMSGGSLRHELIANNLHGHLFAKLLRSESHCKVFSAGIKIELREGTRYVYPDGSVFCEGMEESLLVTGAVMNPVVIIEVLSKSTFSYDYGYKASQYRAMPSVREIVFLNQTRPKAMVYHRKSSGVLFRISDLIGMNAVLELNSIGQSISFQDIYRDVIFKDEEVKQNLLYDPVKPYGRPSDETSLAPRSGPAGRQ